MEQWVHKWHFNIRGVLRKPRTTARIIIHSFRRAPYVHTQPRSVSHWPPPSRVRNFFTKTSFTKTYFMKTYFMKTYFMKTYFMSYHDAGHHIYTPGHGQSVTGPPFPRLETFYENLCYENFFYENLFYELSRGGAPHLHTQPRSVSHWSPVTVSEILYPLISALIVILSPHQRARRHSFPLSACASSRTRHY